MKKYLVRIRIAMQDLATRGVLLIVSGLIVALALAVALSEPARATPLTPPDVPSIIQVPSGNQLFRVSHAVGTQNYICLSTGWAAFGPQATLFNDEVRQTATHFLSRNPDEGGIARPTWQDSLETSTVWANPVPDASYTPDPTAVAWLLLKVVGYENGPEGGDRLSGATFVQRINTTGGLKPTGACKEGDKALVFYTADYLFYRAAEE